MRAGTVRILPVAALVAATAALTVLMVAGLGVNPPKWPYLAVEGSCFVLIAAAVLLLARVPRRAVPALVLAGTLLLGVAGATGPPTLSTDSARYNWDGIVQDSGVSPYRSVPADTALAPLRPQWLFPKTVDGACPGRTAKPTALTSGAGFVCTEINRPLVPTIYPPVAEALFALVRLPLPRDVEFLPMQLLGLLAVLATTALLLTTLARSGRDPRWAAVFGWCPFVTLQAVTNAHVDGSAAFLAVAATVLVVRGRTVLGGVVLGLAVATKFLPVLVVPPIARRRLGVLALTAAGTFAATYVPHVIAVGPSVIGYLPGYLNEEGYDSGDRSALLSAVLPAGASTLVAALLIAALAVVLLLRTDPADPWAAQTLLVGAALVLVNPYPWYALLLLPFMAMSGRWEWFAIVVTLSVPGLSGDLTVFRGVLLTAVAVVVLAGWARRRVGRPNLRAA